MFDYMKAIYRGTVSIPVQDSDMKYVTKVGETSEEKKFKTYSSLLFMTDESKYIDIQTLKECSINIEDKEKGIPIVENLELITDDKEKIQAFF